MQQQDKIKKFHQNLTKLAFNVLKKYKSRVELINMLYKIGTPKYEYMVLELLLLGKDLDSIRKTLLFSEEYFSSIIEGLTDTLKHHDQKVKLFKKLKGN